MKCNFSLFLTVLKLFTTEYKSSVVQLEKYCLTKIFNRNVQSF